MKYFYFSILLFLFAHLVFAQNKITANVISSGGEQSSNASYVLISTVGETFIGNTINTTNQNNIGFWYVYKQSTITDVQKEEETIPKVFKLEQNYPNPFNPSTVIRFGIPERSRVLLKIYDILGNELMTLVNEELDAGWYSRKFNASDYSSGIYIYRVQAVIYVSTKKMLLVK